MTAPAAACAIRARRCTQSERTAVQNTRATVISPEHARVIRRVRGARFTFRQAELQSAPLNVYQRWPHLTLLADALVGRARSSRAPPRAGGPAPSRSRGHPRRAKAERAGRVRAD